MKISKANSNIHKKSVITTSIIAISILGFASASAEVAVTTQPQISHHMRLKTPTQYTKIRFIGFTIPTTAKNVIPVGDIDGKGSFAGDYVGDSVTSKDIQNRVNILMEAIKKAKAAIDANGSNDNSNVINVFVAPEFFFHGIHGPYLWNNKETDVDPIQQAITDLKKQLTTKDYSNWIVVAGTMATLNIKSETKDGTIAEIIAKHTNQNSVIKNDYSKYLDEMIKGKEGKAKKTASTIESFIEDGSKSTPPEPQELIQNRAIVIDNIYDTQVQQDFSVQKENMSNEDLSLLTHDSTGQVGTDTSIMEQMSNYPTLNLTNGDNKTEPMDEKSIFSVQKNLPINMAIETCLDHGDGRLREHSTINNPVYIQIIPSAGMEIVESSVVAAHNGFVFNVDGEYGLSSHILGSEYSNYTGSTYTLPFSSSAYPDKQLTYGAHSELAMVDKAAIGNTSYVSDATFKDITTSVDQTTIAMDKTDTSISAEYSDGNGQIDIYGLKNPMDIKSNK